MVESALGHERRFRAVRRVSAYPLTATEWRTCFDRRLGPLPDITLDQHWTRRNKSESVVERSMPVDCRRERR